MKHLVVILAICILYYLAFSISNLTFNYLMWDEVTRELCSVLAAVTIIGYFLYLQINKETNL